MAGPLGVTHLFLFSRSKSGKKNLRIALTPRGPTLHFQIDKYSLCRDVAKAQKHPRGGGKEYTTAPLLVMNDFSTATDDSPPVLKQLESLTTTIFQSMFAPISPQRTPLTSIRRILLLNRETAADGTYVLNLRHYAITTKVKGISKRIRRLLPHEQRQRESNGTAIPNLGGLDDIADYLDDTAGGGFTSASETEPDTEAEVEVEQNETRRVLSKKEQQKNAAAGNRSRTSKGGRSVEKRKVELVELGPRMKLRMVKVVEGTPVDEGRVMWHEFITKSKAEEKDLEARAEKRRKVKEERRRVQRENVERKKKTRTNTAANGDGRVAEDEEEMVDGWDSQDVEDEEEDEQMEE